MRQKAKFVVLSLVICLLCSTAYLYSAYWKLHWQNANFKRSLIATPGIEERRRDFTKLSNYSSDVIYQPALPNSVHYRLVVVSLSAASYYKRRSAVRSTWNKRLASWNLNYENQIIHYFICFTPKRTVLNDELLLEATQYNDIIIFSDREKYSQLPIQTITALDWVNSQFDFDFVLKTDDDTLINIDEIIDRLEGMSLNSFVGRVYKHRKPNNEGEKVWVEKYHQDEVQEFREFAPGAGYIMGVEAVRIMLSFATQVELTEAEDVYMGEVMGQLGYQITPLHGVYPIWQEFCQKEELANPQWTLIHWLDPERMVRFWERLSYGIGGCKKVDMSRARQQAKKGAFSRN